MRRFNKELVLEKMKDKKSFKVFVSFDYHTGSDDIITIPKGFVTDLASIPMIVRGIIPRVGKHCQAAVVHDFIYQRNTFSRKKCDKIFLECMTVLGVPRWKRKLMYRAVRLFGGFCWKKYNVEEN